MDSSVNYNYKPTIKPIPNSTQKAKIWSNNDIEWGKTLMKPKKGIVCNKVYIYRGIKDDLSDNDMDTDEICRKCQYTLETIYCKDGKTFQSCPDYRRHKKDAPILKDLMDSK